MSNKSQGRGVEPALIQHAEESYPEECVGALFARNGVLIASLALENAAVDRRRSFEVSAREYLRAEAESERLGATLYGFYHSHPDAPATPSAHDHASWFPLLSFSVRNGKADPLSAAAWSSPHRDADGTPVFVREQEHVRGTSHCGSRHRPVDS